MGDSSVPPFPHPQIFGPDKTLQVRPKEGGGGGRSMEPKEPPQPATAGTVGRVLIASIY